MIESITGYQNVCVTPSGDGFCVSGQSTRVEFSSHTSGAVRVRFTDQQTGAQDDYIVPSEAFGRVNLDLPSLLPVASAAKCLLAPVAGTA